MVFTHLTFQIHIFMVRFQNEDHEKAYGVMHIRGLVDNRERLLAL